MQKDLLDILACPKCHGTLELKTENSQEVGLVCKACSLLYPIRNDIPIMLIEEAQKLEDPNLCASS